ncbi:hypothetical protein Tco_1176620 [Tanacetum coccineum]
MLINLPCLNSKKELAIQEQTATDKESTNPLMADSLPKTIVPTKLVKPQGFNLRRNMGVTDMVNEGCVCKHGKRAENEQGSVSVVGKLEKLGRNGLDGYVLS